MRSGWQSWITEDEARLLTFRRAILSTLHSAMNPWSGVGFVNPVSLQIFVRMRENNHPHTPNVCTEPFSEFQPVPAFNLTSHLHPRAIYCPQFLSFSKPMKLRPSNTWHLPLSTDILYSIFFTAQSIDNRLPIPLLLPEIFKIVFERETDKDTSSITSLLPKCLQQAGLASPDPLQNHPLLFPECS